jgi:hypothetical protein
MVRMVSLVSMVRMVRLLRLLRMVSMVSMVIGGMWQVVGSMRRVDGWQCKEHESRTTQKSELVIPDTNSAVDSCGASS